MSFRVENGILIKYIEEPKETKVVIPDGVTKIGDWAFEGCTGLTEIVIPDGVTEIGECVFYACDALTNIVLSDSVGNMSRETFDGCVNLKCAVIRVHTGSIRIEEDTFDSDCTVKVYADTPEAYMRLDIDCDHRLFLNGEEVTDIVLPSGMTSIPDGAFTHCVSLKSIVIPDGVTEIGGGAFEGCTGLTEIVIPNGVTEIEYNTFSGCIGLKSLTVPDSVTHFWSSLEGCDDVSVHISFSGLCNLYVSGDIWEHYTIEISDEEASLEAYCAVLDRVPRWLSKDILKSIEEKLLLSPRCAAAEYFESRRRFAEYAEAHKIDEDTLCAALMSGPDSNAAKTKLCTAFLFRAFLQKSGWPAQKWKSTYPVEPARTAAARLLVWQQGDTAFTLDEAGVPVDVCGHPVQLTEDDIFLAHPMEMQEGTAAAWRDYFTARHLTQPFVQMWEPVHDPGDIRPDRYRGRPIKWELMEHREKHGIICGKPGTEPPQKVMLFGKEAEISLSLLTCTGSRMADLADCKVHQRYEDKGQLITFSDFDFETYTRQVNHIVVYLDRCTVRDRILEDDIPERGCLDSLSLPEILELIDLAVQNHCVNAAAALQQYKQERFGDAFPAETLAPLP